MIERNALGYQQSVSDYIAWMFCFEPHLALLLCGSRHSGRRTDRTINEGVFTALCACGRVLE